MPVHVLDLLKWELRDEPLEADEKTHAANNVHNKAGLHVAQDNGDPEASRSCQYDQLRKHSEDWG